MRYILGLLLALLLLAWLWPGGGQSREGDVGRALTELVGALAAAFRWYALLDRAVQERLWEIMGDELLPLLGALKCLFLVLALWGAYSLRLLRRLGRRIL